MCYHNLNPYSIAGTTKNLVVSGVSCFFPKTPILTHVTGCLKSHLPAHVLVPNLQGLPLAATHSRARGMIGWNWRAVQLSGHVMFWHNMIQHAARTPKTKQVLFLAEWISQTCRCADLLKTKVRFRHPKISLCDNHHNLQQFSALLAEYIRVDPQSVCPEWVTISHANFGPKLEDSETCP